MRRLRHNLETATGLQLTEPDGNKETELPYQPAKPRLKSAAALPRADNWRNARALMITLAWIDGTVGRGFETISEDAMSEQTRARVHDDLRH